MINCEINGFNNKEEINEVLYNNFIPTDHARCQEILEEWTEEILDNEKLNKEIDRILIKITTSEDCKKEIIVKLKGLIRKIRDSNKIYEEYKKSIQKHSLLTSYCDALSIVLKCSNK